jgi:malate permease and related proteins
MDPVAYWNIFVDNLLPIFLMAGAGFALGRRFHPDLRTVTRLSFYIFSPCLVFTSLTHAELSGAEFGRMALFTVLVNGAMLVLALLVGLGLRLQRQALATLIIAAVFVNGGNYGLAVIKFAFGEAALSRAVVYYVASTLMVYSVGVLVASAGKRPLKQALLQGWTLPSTYAVLLAGLLRFTHWQTPLVMDRAVTLLSQAAIPVMLIILGLQMASMKTWPHHQWGLIGVAVFLQLVIAPLLGLGLANLLGLEGVTRQAAVLETAMPTAVITTVLAVEYELDAAFMTGVVILSTLLSPLTVTPLIAFLLG